MTRIDEMEIHEMSPPDSRSGKPDAGDTRRQWWQHQVAMKVQENGIGGDEQAVVLVMMTFIITKNAFSWVVMLVKSIKLQFSFPESRVFQIIAHQCRKLITIYNKEVDSAISLQ